VTEEKVERPIIKCQGQVVNVRLPHLHERPEQGKLSTISLTTQETSQLGYLYLRQSQGYPLGYMFEIEIKLHRIPSKEFFVRQGWKSIPNTNGVNPV